MQDDTKRDSSVCVCVSFLVLGKYCCYIWRRDATVRWRVWVYDEATKLYADNVPGRAVRDTRWLQIMNINWVYVRESERAYKMECGKYTLMLMQHRPINIFTSKKNRRRHATAHLTTQLHNDASRRSTVLLLLSADKYAQIYCCIIITTRHACGGAGGAQSISHAEMNRNSSTIWHGTYALKSRYKRACNFIKLIHLCGWCVLLSLFILVIEGIYF